MMDYILTVDSRQIEIPGVNQESFSDDLLEPVKTVDGTLIYATDRGAKVICEKTTVPKADSNKTYWELFGYLKGRAGQKETIYLERLGSTIEGYIRITNADSRFAGKNGTRRAMNIEIWEA